MDLLTLMQQCKDDSRRWFPDESLHSPSFTTLCLAGEVGELANIVKKIQRGSLTLPAALSGSGLKEPIQFEIVDVLVYLLNLMALDDFKDVDWPVVWNQKREYNEARFAGPKSLEDFA